MKTKTSLVQIRTRIEVLKAEQAALLNQRRCRAEVVEAVEGQLRDYDIKGRAAFARGLYMLAAGSAGSPFIQTGVADAESVVRVDVGPLLVATVGIDRMREVYLAEIESVPQGLTRTERIARLTEIATALDEAETAEEALIVASEAAGVPIARRSDARPEIILGTPL